MDYEAILTEAHAAADAAQAGMVEDMNAFDCGFAWVTIDGNEPLAKFCRKAAKSGGRDYDRRRYGDKGYPKGWQFWGPGAFNGQAIGIKVAGANAFRDVLSLKYQIRADVGSQYD